MSERISIYLDASTMLKLHDIHKKVAAGVPGGVSMSKAVAYAIIQAYAAEFNAPLAIHDPEVQEAVAAFSPGGKYYRAQEVLE